MMLTENIYTLQDAERYIEGCLNDFAEGISTKGETMKYMLDYTLRIVEIAQTPINNKL